MITIAQRHTAPSEFNTFPYSRSLYRRSEAPLDRSKCTPHISWQSRTNIPHTILSTWAQRSQWIQKKSSADKASNCCKHVNSPNQNHKKRSPIPAPNNSASPTNWHVKCMCSICLCFGICVEPSAYSQTRFVAPSTFSLDRIQLLLLGLRFVFFLLLSFLYGYTADKITVSWNHVLFMRPSRKPFVEDMDSVRTIRGLQRFKVVHIFFGHIITLLPRAKLKQSRAKLSKVSAQHQILIRWSADFRKCSLWLSFPELCHLATRRDMHKLRLIDDDNAAPQPFPTLGSSESVCDRKLGLNCILHLWPREKKVITAPQ